MIDKNAYIEKIIFDTFVQTNINVSIKNDKDSTVIKKGKLLNFNIKLPFLYFIFEHKTASKEYILPQPFTFKYGADKKQLILSYKFADFTQNKKLINLLYKQSESSDCKYINKYLYIDID